MRDYDRINKMKVLKFMINFPRAIGCGRRYLVTGCRRYTVSESDNISLSGGSSVFNGSVSPWFLQLNKYAERIAVVDGNGVHRYRDLAYSMNSLTDRIADELNASNDDSKGERICILCPNDVSYVVAQLSTWMSGSMAVPLSDKHPPAHLEYFIQDSQCRTVITTEQFLSILRPITDRLAVNLVVLQKPDYCVDPSVYLKQMPDRWTKRFNRLQQLRETNQYKNRRALIVYTSGTTGNPKVSYLIMLMPLFSAMHVIDVN